MRRSVQFRGTVTLWFVVAVGGCGPSPSSDNAGWADDPRDVLRRGNGGEPSTLDPALADDVHAFRVLADLYEGLVVLAANGAIEPGVAERWELSGDGKTYTFHLRRYANWSDGTPVIAADFVTALCRAAEPNSRVPLASLLDPIQNFQQVATGRSDVSDLGVTALDDSTLEIRLSYPAQHFLGVLALPIAAPRHAGSDADPSRFRDADQFVGNGPYVLAGWRPGTYLRLRKNDAFHAASTVAIPFVEYLSIENPVTEVNLYRAGDLDLTESVPTGMISSLRNTHPDELRIAPLLGVYYLAFDLGEPPLDRPGLRRALSMAIDRDRLVDLLGRGERPAFGLVPPGVAGHSPARYAWRSLAAEEREREARTQYASAGYSDSNPLRITLLYDAGDIHEKVALAIGGMWREVLGANVEYDKREWKYFLATRNDRADWQIMRFAWFGDYDDATTFTDIFHSDSPQNLPGYRSAIYDSLLEEAAKTADFEKRRTLLHRAEQELLGDYAIAPVYFLVSKHLVSPRIGGFESNVMDRHGSRYLYFRQRP